MNGIIERVKAEERLGSKFGIERTQALLDGCGRPDEKLKIIHVAGTNGKGSVCEYLSRIITASGARAGVFTSPEVFSFNEKFKINGEPANDEKISLYIQRITRLSLGMPDRPSSFEIQTAAALLMFAEEGCEYAVVECGLGGLNDATNAISRKLLAVIASVSLEHTAVLGDTVGEICAQKAGIIKNCPVVAPCNLPSEAYEYLSRYDAVFAGDGLKILNRDEYGQTFSYRGEIYEIKMHGDAQAYNAAVAIECAKLLNFPSEAVKRGLKEAELAGRVQIIKSRGRTYLLDGSHNPESFTPLLQTLELFAGKKSLVFGCLSDKDVNSAASRLAGVFDEVILVVPDSYRAMEIDKMQAAFSPRAARTETAACVAEALRAAQYQSVAVCGTFTILKEAEEWIEKEQ